MKRAFMIGILSFFAFVVPAFAGSGFVADVALNPMGDFKAKVDGVKGEAIQEGDSVKAENVIFDLRNLSTGLALRDKHAKEKYLEVEKYPEAKLISATGKNGLGRAKISFHGKEKEVDGEYKVEGGFLLADFPLKLSDFGITGVGYKGIGVDDTVQVHATIPLKKAAPPAKK